MKLVLVGHGKVGKLVEEVAIQRGHTITAQIHPKGNISSISAKAVAGADVCVDFSHPEAVVHNVRELAKLKKNVVVGTTGWYEHLDQIKQLVHEHQIGFLYSPNFSIGVQLFFKILAEAAAKFSKFEDYDVGLFEAHHRHKSDSPSGTAKALCDVLLKEYKNKKRISTNSQGTVAPDELHVSSLRCGSIPGTHTVIFDSPADSITLTHQARNREGFARGAVTAAEWLKGKKGFFTIEDVLGDL